MSATMNTNADLAAALDALEIAPGGTVTAEHLAIIRSVSDALKAAPAPVVPTVVVEPAPVPAIAPAPVPSKSTAS